MSAEVTTVVAQFKYEYVYEGKTISFKKGDTFQLLNTSNNDWWQVRRWLENGTCENLYVPANYMKKVEKEVDPTSSHLYQNMSDLQAEYKRAKSQISSSSLDESKNDGPKRPTGRDGAGKKSPPKTSPKLVRTKSSGNAIDTPTIQQPANGYNKPHPPGGTTEPEYAIPVSPVSSRRGMKKDEQAQPPAAGPIAKERIQGYSLPMKKRTQSVDTLDEEEGAAEKTQLPRKSVPTILEGDTTHRHQLESSFTKQLANTLASGIGGGGAAPPTTGGNKLVTAPKPKPRSGSRPKSYCIENDDRTAEVSTFKATNTFGVPVPENEEQTNILSSSSREAPPTARKSYKRQQPQQQPQPVHEYDVPDTRIKNKSAAAATEVMTPKSFQIPNPLSQPPPVIATSSPTPSPVSPLPDGWSEHKTADGRVYYHNSLTNESKWTMPTVTTPTSTTPIVTAPPQVGSHSGPPDPIDRVAPRGWTKEINSFTQTPVYTNCRTEEKWALGKDDNGYYYYSMSNAALRLKDLPVVEHFVPTTTTTTADEGPSRSQSDIYDHLTPSSSSSLDYHKRTRTVSEDDSTGGVVGGGASAGPVAGVKEHAKLDTRSSLPVGASSQDKDIFSSRLAAVHKKLGYLQKKRVLEAGGKKVRSDKWVKQFTVLQGHQLIFYNDHRTKDNPGVKPTATFQLLRANLNSPKDKKKHVIFVTSSVTGEQFYLQADSSQMLNEWYTMLQAAIDFTNEDCRKNPSKYSSFLKSMEGTDSSPPSHPKFPHNRKESLPRTVDDEDIEDYESLSGAEKTVRIKGRLKNLIARRPQVELLKKTGIMQESVFGCELVHLSEREHSLVPKFMTHFIEHIERKGLETVGLYRLSGNAAQVQKLRYLVEDNPHVNLNSPEWADVNIITGCLKLYLRELPDPIIPFRQFRSIIDAARMQPPEKRLLAIRSELDRLPDAHYHTLKTLINHLRKVVEYGHINKMMSTNVSIVFGPTLMRAEVDSIEMATLMPVQNNIVETFLTETEKVFSK